MEPLLFCLIKTRQPYDCMAGVLGPDGYYRISDGSRIPFDHLIQLYRVRDDTIEFFTRHDFAVNRQIFLDELSLLDMHQLLLDTRAVAREYQHA
jgi:hypothetical protein